MFIKLIRNSVLILLLVLTWQTNTYGATVGFASTGSLVTIADLDIVEGSSFDLDVVGIDFVDLISGFLDLSFDPAVLQIDSVVINNVLFAYLPDGGRLATPGLWTDIVFDVDTNIGDLPATDSFSIASVSLTALAQGSSALTIPSSGFFGSAGLLTPTLESININVTPIPIPASLLLFLTGIIGLIARFRKEQ